MIYRLIFIALLIISSNSFGQTIEELEYDLSWYQSSEKYGDKIDKARKLQALDPFNKKATDYICRYYYDRKIDSVSIYFANLIAKYPDKTEPYLLRTDFLSFEHDYRQLDEFNRLKVLYLKQGLNINPNDHLVVFKLAEVFYSDFIFPMKREKNWELSNVSNKELIDSSLIPKKGPVKKSTFEYAADSSLKYFYRLWDLKPDLRDIIFFPIRQIECFLKQSGKSPIPKDTEKNFNHCFYPSSYFANLKENWQCDYTIDLHFEIKSGKRKAEWLETQLISLNESCLFNKDIPPNSAVYRFTWLRSFHNPIAIRIENNETGVMLYWKLGKGAGGYAPKGLKKSGKKKLSLKKWVKFESLIKNSNFDSLSNEKYTPMFDGATWTLERKKSDSFKAHDTNSPSKEFSTACLYLINLANFKVKKEDKY
jgi:hypothetical protein